ncbi:DUF547 domain-containing protein [Natrialbaceae archaeon AArc-T1-2]|uniref:DUF547 domain-containing protein n=1 Tax=Natrialbaceae archaeon AArc-T1-2 TaxID=3053904 RepID=UPI00255AFC02|nr:DUF547 domain-containing protein [Natrialbaceae archaeon AArc-T1-2]WIV67815.1 DUF547 domain-containing protein [Natrialbaceae archaeon AArc-T1-2]
MSTQLDPISVAADLLYAVKTGGDVDSLRRRLATLERDRLSRALSSHRQRLAFWLNCYNAYVQLRLDAEPSGLEGGILARWKFRVRDRIPVAGVRLSLADIEHGMLRRSAHPWGLGYVPRPFPSSFERAFRLESVDPRIHFALDTGTENGPPITIYSPADCDEELEVATEWYVDENVRYDHDRETVRLPRLFLWYRGDFGGKRGIRELLARHGVIPAGSKPALEYEKRDWSIDVDP